MTINGKRIERRGSVDECGNKFRTKREASAAREAAIVALRTEKTIRPKPVRKLVKEVFEEFCTEGRKDRAYQTIRKQDSIRENHLRDRFGNKYVDEISSADVVDYLSELYYVEGKAFKYSDWQQKMDDSHQESPIENALSTRFLLPEIPASARMKMLCQIDRAFFYTINFLYL